MIFYIFLGLFFWFTNYRKMQTDNNEVIILYFVLEFIVLVLVFIYKKLSKIFTNK